MNEPLVSIVVITYNSSKYVVETLDSIRLQTYQNIELIISDDASSDNTITICKSWLKQNESRYVRTEVVTSPKNTGIPANCNRGINVAHGEWVKLIAGDDVLCPDYLALCLKHIVNKKEQEIHFLYTNIERFGLEKPKGKSDLSKLKINKNSITAKEQFQILLRYNPILAVSFISHNETLKKLGGFNEKYPLFEDWPMWLNITQMGYKIHYLDIVGVKYRMHSESVQLKKSKANQFINDFNLAKSQMILNEYILYYPYFERILRKYINSTNLIFREMNINNNSRIIYFIYHFITYIPRMILNKIRSRYI